jgi:hypothetical protein
VPSAARFQYEIDLARIAGAACTEERRLILNDRRNNEAGID